MGGPGGAVNAPGPADRKGIDMSESTNTPARVEFIKVHLDEDDEMARAGFTHPERWVRVAPIGTPNGLSCTAVQREVEAKRKLLDLAEAMLGTFPVDDAARLLLHQSAEEILTQLAAPYEVTAGERMTR